MQNYSFCGLWRILSVHLSRSRRFSLHLITLYRALLIIDRSAASIRTICTRICSFYHSCAYRFTLLRCCITKRSIFHQIICTCSIFSLVDCLQFNEYVFFFSPDPTYVVAPVLQSRSGRKDLRKLFAGSIIILISTVSCTCKATFECIWFSLAEFLLHFSRMR